MCEFCKEIDDTEIVNNANFKGEYPPRNEDGIYKMKDGTFGMWADACDIFNAYWYLTDVKYCPVCGRGLKGSE